ncbi:MAG: hypothetical protein C0458_05625 [Methylobacterium sp.]|nr:hypothetical protein [Methylobacterium sp.]
MTVYRKCRPCKHRGNCEIQEALGEAVRGFGVGTISHRCRKYEPFLKPGDHVWVRAFEGPYENDEYRSYAPALAEFPAHFVQFSKTLGRAVVFIKPGAESRDGDTTFEPANNKDGFCKVSYAPIRDPRPYARAKGITEHREGFTATMTCCGRPMQTPCRECGNALSELEGAA